MNNYVLVMIGGAIGSAARYGLTRLLPVGVWPWATFAANVSGGLLMGMLMGWLMARGGDTEKFRLLFGVGVLGGYTTFSTFSLEIANILEQRDYGLAAGYIFASVCVSVAAVIGGFMLVRRLAL